jgi:hypothetical protein
MKRCTLPLLVLLLVSILASTTTQAFNRKTDVISFYNGDKITGEIVSLLGGILELSTDSMGRVKIEWQDIARLESQFNYEIRLSNGQRHYGTINSGDRPGEVTLQDLYGDHNVESLSIVELRPIEEEWYDRIEVYLSAQYNYTKASSVQSATLNTEISYEDEQSQSKLTGRITNTETNEDDTSSSRVDLSRRIWTNRAEVFRLLYGNYESNDELGLDRRIAGGIGIGKFYIDTNKNRLVGAVGLQGVTERKVDVSGDEQSVELFLGGEYAAWRFDTPEMDISLNGALYPSITESGRWRADTDIRIRWELIEDLFWDLSAWGTYDNEADSGNEFDYGIATGIGWEY